MTLEEAKKIIEQQKKQIEDQKEEIHQLEEALSNRGHHHDQRYIDCWNSDIDGYHERAYGSPTYEEGGIADYTGASSHINASGEPDGWWK